MKLRTSISPSGKFIYGIHKPSYKVTNLREGDFIGPLGELENGSFFDNQQNFPTGNITIEKADCVYEIPNPFPFRGTTFINKSWADKNAKNPIGIALPKPQTVSMTQTLKNLGSKSSNDIDQAFSKLPEPILLTLASTSTDPDDLARLAKISCDFVYDQDNRPIGLQYKKDNNRTRAVIKNFELFEVVVNNIYLPDEYKEVMALRPGVQGGSEIVGEYTDDTKQTHIFEYLRSNSYIPWGHYASNMANDSIRYDIAGLTSEDMTGLRHLYYQRTYTRMAEQFGLPIPAQRKSLHVEQLETLRQEIISALKNNPDNLQFNSTLWGWNYGFDFAASRYRLHASHQQIHQQFALLPPDVASWHSGDETAQSNIPSYACGDQVADFCSQYEEETGKKFFDTYIQAIRNNCRMDELSNDASLIIFEDKNVMLFVPKTQTSQWELQLMTLGPIGNILEADTNTRNSLDNAMLIAMKVLTAMGARMISVIEFSKRFDSSDTDQRLLYSFLPKLPYSMGAFSEAQLRWINGHFPEDFAIACRATREKEGRNS